MARRLQAVVLNLEGRTAPQIADVLKVHPVNVSIGGTGGARMGWKEYWKATGPVVLPTCPHVNDRSWSTSSTVAPWPMDSLPVAGPAPW